MRIWQGVCLGLLLVPLILGISATVEAASVSGRASTVLEWYDTAAEETAIPGYQYLQLNVKDLVSKGYNFKLYGRLADDFADETDVDSRLYYAYLEKRDLFDGFDFRLGRQFISTTAGASMMDGLSLRYECPAGYSVRVFGGGDVKYYDGYNIKDVIDGIELGGKFFDGDLTTNVSYLQKWDQGLIAQELVGFDADYDLGGRLWLYNELQWDLISERLSYALVGGKYRFNQPFTLRLEYLYSMPVFSATSIYSVFAVDEYKEILAELTWKISRDVQLYGRLTHEMYEEFDDADVIEVGVEKLRTGQFYGYLSGVYRNDDDGQGMYGVKAYGNYRVLEPLQIGVGCNVDVLERDIAYYDTDDSDQNETTSTRVWADVKYEFSDKINTTAKIEYIKSDLWDRYNRGTLRLNVLF